MNRFNFLLTAALWVFLAPRAFAETHKIRLPQAPTAVKTTINETLKGGKLKELLRRVEDGETTFEATMTRGAVTREFVIAPDGELLSLEIGLEETPAAVRAIIQRVAGTGKIERIDKTFEDGEASFEISMERDGKSRDFTVSSNGVLTRYEMSFEELPPLIRKAVQASVAVNQIERVDRTFDNGELDYDVQFTTNGETRVLTIGTNGVLSRIEVGLNEISVAVRKTIQAQLRGWKLGDIDKSIDEGEITYEVTAKKGRATREFTVDPNGKLLSETIELTDLPDAARKTIQNKVGIGKIARIERAYDEGGKVSFDIESKKDGKPFDFSVAADGTFLGEN
jgi:uncharacterized membrane protein YkoI